MDTMTKIEKKSNADGLRRPWELMGGFAPQPRLRPRARGFARAACQMAPHLRPCHSLHPTSPDVPAGTAAEVIAKRLVPPIYLY
jgi:hypothetical protein